MAAAVERAGELMFGIAVGGDAFEAKVAVNVDVVHHLEVGVLVGETLRCGGILQVLQVVDVLNLIGVFGSAGAVPHLRGDGVDDNLAQIRTVVAVSAEDVACELILEHSVGADDVDAHALCGQTVLTKDSPLHAVEG